ncbi:hypothetical protein QJS10_CPB12g01349 [Acorus calamus]|uniref:Uncharacterized protein n=1 Tax=Acorus calamus TaxID=4465 RepID=A0AAV9DQS5_ACOCL|nr:hypothetical protein QJS10_CPB12g01349 [Acorus calamus]
MMYLSFSIPRWLEPDSSFNHAFVPGPRLSWNPRLVDSLKTLPNPDVVSRASDAVEAAVNRRQAGYPYKMSSNVHNVRVRVPVPVAQVLKPKPFLASLAVEGMVNWLIT